MRAGRQMPRQLWAVSGKNVDCEVSVRNTERRTLFLRAQNRVAVISGLGYMISWALWLPGGQLTWPTAFDGPYARSLLCVSGSESAGTSIETVKESLPSNVQCRSTVQGHARLSRLNADVVFLGDGLTNHKKKWAAERAHAPNWHA